MAGTGWRRCTRRVDSGAPGVCWRDGDREIKTPLWPGKRLLQPSKPCLRHTSPSPFQPSPISGSKICNPHNADCTSKAEAGGVMNKTFYGPGRPLLPPCRPESLDRRHLYLHGFKNIIGQGAGGQRHRHWRCQQRMFPPADMSILPAPNLQTSGNISRPIRAWTPVAVSQGTGLLAAVDSPSGGCDGYADLYKYSTNKPPECK